MAEAESWLRPFEERAAKAEERLDNLESALARLGLDVTSTASGAGASADISGNLGQSVQLEQKADEVDKLATENAKLKYRILHLTRSLREVDEQHGKLVERLSSDNAKLRYQNLHLIRSLKEIDARVERITGSGA